MNLCVTPEQEFGSSYYTAADQSCYQPGQNRPASKRRRRRRIKQKSGQTAQSDQLSKDLPVPDKSSERQRLHEPGSGDERQNQVRFRSRIKVEHHTTEKVTPSGHSLVVSKRHSQISTQSNNRIPNPRISIDTLALLGVQQIPQTHSCPEPNHQKYKVSTNGSKTRFVSRSNDADISNENKKKAKTRPINKLRQVSVYARYYSC